MVYCPNCGAKIGDDSKFCSYCGYDTKSQNSSSAQSNYQEPATNSGYQQSPPAYTQARVSSPAPKERIVAGILALLVGGLGVHKFYLGNIGMGILYLVFCWTGIPGIIGFIEGIIYLTKTDEEFYHDHVLPIEQGNSV